jgi:hypothetical protein
MRKKSEWTRNSKHGAKRFLNKLQIESFFEQEKQLALWYIKWQLNIAIVIGLFLKLSDVVCGEGRIDLNLMMLGVVRE